MLNKKKLQRIIRKLHAYWNTVESTGIHADMSYMEMRKTKMLNQVALVCIPLTLFFSCANWMEGRYLLSVINYANFITSASIFLFHAYRKYTAARFVLLCFNSLFFWLGAYFFHNGAEYFLLSSLIIAMLIFEERWIQITSSAIIILAMMIIIFMPQPTSLEALIPAERLAFNFIGSLVFIVFAIAVFKDIQFSYQQEIETQQKKLQEMNSNMERLFSIIAHDIRSPISSTQTMLTLFQNQLISAEKVNETISSINNRLTQLDETLDNLLKWSIRNMDGIQTKPTVLQLEEALDRVYQFLEPQAFEKKINLVKNIDPSAIIYVDYDQFLVILRNILSNAIKFSFLNGNVSSIGIIKGGYVKLTIRDHGVGIPAQKIAQLFNSIQTPSFGTEGERGSGLGLLLCHELLRKNGGEMHIESAPDMGTTVVMSFPLSHRL